MTYATITDELSSETSSSVYASIRFFLVIQSLRLIDQLSCMHYRFQHVLINAVACLVSKFFLSSTNLPSSIVLSAPEP